MHTQTPDPAAMRRIRRHIENFNSPDKDVSSRAEGYLIRYYGARALEPLIEACDHPNPVVRYRAVWALGRSHDPRAFETILRLTDDPEEGVRYDATIALGILNDDRAIGHLIRIELMNDHTRPACEGLYRMGPRILPELRILLEQGNAMNRSCVVSIAASFAREHGDEASIALLKEFLLDEDDFVRGEAEWWLKELGAT